MRDRRKNDVPQGGESPDRVSPRARSSSSARLGILLVMAASLCWGAFRPAVSLGREPAERFLDGLRQRHYYDIALEYLQRMRTDPNCPDSLGEVIDYEIGFTQVELSRRTTGLQQREQHLDAARDAFRRFLKDHPSHELAAAAGTQLANVLVERGKNKLEAANRPDTPPADKNALLGEARKFFVEAKSALEDAENLCYQRAKSLQGLTDKDEQKARLREQADKDLLQARLLLANISEQIGRTYPAGSQQRKEMLTKAAAKYNELYEKYENLVGGLYARMWEGRVYRDLGQSEKAAKVLLEMLTLPDQPPAFRALKQESLVLLLEMYLEPGVKKYGQAVEQAAAWEARAAAHEESSPEGLEIHFLAGRAALEFARSLKPNDKDRRGRIKDARRQLEFVARFQGEYRRQANALLMDKLLGEKTAEQSEPKTFAEAKEKADFAWGTMLVASGRAGGATNPKQKAEFTKKAEDARGQALAAYRLALRLADGQTAVSDLNSVRFRLTYLYWVAQDLYRSAVLGEFLAMRYPQAFGAQKGAEIAVKAYRVMFTQDRQAGRDTRFEERRMESLANYLAARWAGQPEADEARMVLIDTAVDKRDLEKAKSLLEKMPEDSSRRGQAELRLGQALWAEYVRDATLEENRPPQEKLDALAQQAQQMLRTGIERMRKGVDAGGAVQYPLVYSVLSLAQILIDAGRPAEAVKWLDDPKIGPITLIKAGHPAVAAADFQIDTYKAALRAYVGAQQLDQAEATMNALEQLVSKDQGAEGSRRLTQVYIALGRRLEEMLARLRGEGKQAEMKKVSHGFELFLTRISQRKEGVTFNSLNWVAETFFSLGAGMDPGRGEIPPEAKRYYEEAAKTYIRILQQKPQGMSEVAGTTIRVRLAACLRAMGRHDKALALLIGVLKQREKRVDVQIEAARTYQDWGKVSGKPEYYTKAMLGGYPQGGTNLVWGWAGIANRVVSFDKYRSFFHEARYNLALCRLGLARSRSGEEKAKTLQQAEADITRTYQLYPKMGGPEWFPKYDALLKEIRKERGIRNPQGLKESK